MREAVVADEMMTSPGATAGRTRGLCKTLGLRSTQGRTWWMIPEPGFQKPTPYLAPAVARKSYTSTLVLIANLRSAVPPKLPSLSG